MLCYIKLNLYANYNATATQQSQEPSIANSLKLKAMRIQSHKPRAKNPKTTKTKTQSQVGMRMCDLAPKCSK